jgi:hypothetical protein
VKVNIGNKDVSFDSTTGVKQGCIMAPLLFAIYFQAANEVLSAVVPISSTLMFKTEKDFVFSGRKVTQTSTALELSLDKHLYADDKTKLADSRENLHSSNLVLFVTLDEMVLNPRLRPCAFQHQVSDMKMLILIFF